MWLRRVSRSSQHRQSRLLHHYHRSEIKFWFLPVPANLPSTELHQLLGPPSIFHHLFTQGKTRSKDLTFPHLIRIHSTNIYSHKTIKRSQVLSSQPQFPDLRILVKICRALWSEFSKWQLKQRSSVNIVIINQGQRAQTQQSPSTTRFPTQSSGNVAQSAAEQQPRGQSASSSTHPF